MHLNELEFPFKPKAHPHTYILCHSFCAMYGVNRGSADTGYYGPSPENRT